MVYNETPTKGPIMTTIKEKIAKTKKFVSDHSDDILLATTSVLAFSSGIIALKLIKEARVTEGVWKTTITDEIREQMNVEGAKFQTTIIVGETPTWRITTPED